MRVVVEVVGVAGLALGLGLPELRLAIRTNSTLRFLSFCDNHLIFLIVPEYGDRIIDNAAICDSKICNFAVASEVWNARSRNCFSYS